MDQKNGLNHQSRRGDNDSATCGRPACQGNWRAEEELVPEILMKAAGDRSVEYVNQGLWLEGNRDSYILRYIKK